VQSSVPLRAQGARAAVLETLSCRELAPLHTRVLSAQVPPRFARLIAKKCPDSDRREAIALGKAALRVKRLPRDFGGDNCSAGSLPCVFAAHKCNGGRRRRV